MRVKITINKKLDNKEVMEKLKMVLFRSMLKMHEIATRIVPVDTGKLKTSINVEPMIFGAKKYVLGSGVEYGPHVEFGTYKMSAQPFMRPALIQVKNIWVKRFMKSEFK
jgi:HK97 gp10 family phage protein